MIVMKPTATEEEIQAVIRRIESCDCLSFRNNTAEIDCDCANTARDLNADCRLIVGGEGAVGGYGLTERRFGDSGGFDFTRFGILAGALALSL